MELQEMETKIEVEKAEAKVGVYEKELEIDENTRMAIEDIPQFKGDAYTESFVFNYSNAGKADTTKNAESNQNIFSWDVINDNNTTFKATSISAVSSSSNLIYTSSCAPIPSILKPNVAPFQPLKPHHLEVSKATQQTTPAVYDIQQQQQKGDDYNLMSNIFKELRAPNVQLDPFSGNSIDFPFFMANFTQAIEEKVRDDKGRLQRPIQFTDGPAKELAKSCIYLPEESCYVQAKKLLAEKFGNPFVVNAEYRKKLGS